MRTISFYELYGRHATLAEKITLAREAYQNYTPEVKRRVWRAPFNSIAVVLLGEPNLDADSGKLIGWGGLP